MQPISPPLVDQPTAAPTRKWTAATIAELATVILAVAAMFGFDLQITPDDVVQVVAGVAVLVSAAGRIAAYFTRNQAVD